MTNILVTGSNGQLGSEIRELVEGEAKATHPENSSLGCAALAAPSGNYFFTDRNSLDITDATAIKKFIDSNNINTIINCAAYTAVDQAEDDEVNADKINHQAVKNIAMLSNEFGIKLIHISTDYVFDGKNFKPYNEDDTTNPQGIYGKTKLDGENIIKEYNLKNSIIIRTSWVYSSFGANFVKTMMRLGSERDSLGVIFDQVGTPTYARDLAKAILDIVPNINSEKVEIYNYSNEGVLSWYDFARDIMDIAKLECQVNPIETKEYPTPAARPHYSLLNKAKIKKDFNITIPYYKDSLKECIEKLKKAN